MQATSSAAVLLPARGVFQPSCVGCGRGSLSTNVMSVKIGDTVSLRLTPRITGLRASWPVPGWQEPSTRATE